ncbi:hypothetical protein INT45_009194 [Circinella minor]|uniref:Uncharacterized protein n=1 Tax=Circinella minor TaxID=1195481 RepID=A0A8H7SHF0_9FUNG|nr:hypothetical protein INT45_009194 [Circinella minor]
MNFDHVVICNQHTNRQRHHSPSYSNDFTTAFNNNSRGRAIIDSSSYFDEYDHTIESVQLKADLEDYCYGFYNQQQHQHRQQNENSSTACIEQEHQQQRYRHSQHTQQQLERVEKDYYFPEYYDEEEVVEAVVSPEEEEEDDRKSASSMESYNNDALLYLILNVQSYISEMSNSSLMNETDSPLFGLQYKMYTYMKQRASEVGFNVDSLPPPP